MSGIDRLRAIAGAWDEWGLGGTLADIAEQIERERDAEVADSPYDAILPEDRDALTWVRDHGGIDHVKAEWHSRVPYDRYDRRRQRLLGHIAECETALRRRNQRIEELGKTIEFFQLNNSNFRHLLADVAERLGFTRYGDDYEPEDLLDAIDRRLMPEGYEWPRYEDGSPVVLSERDHRPGTVSGVAFVYHDAVIDYRSPFVEINPLVCKKTETRIMNMGERVKRPAVLAADGEPLEVGETVWHVATGSEYTVRSCTNGGAHLSRDGKPAGYCRAEYLTHQRPVLGADGVPIHEGDTVYEVGEKYTPFTVLRLPEVNEYQSVKIEYPNGTYTWRDPVRLTHTKPEPPDSWERIEEDARGLDSGVDRELFTHTHEDLVRRCRALADRERGE